MISLEQLSILAIGIGSILWVYWFFFGNKSEQVGSGSVIPVKVDAGYTPSTIEVKKGKQVTLKLLRTDSSSCLDQLIIPQWNIVRALPLNQELTVTFIPKETGEFPFHCGMNMFHGKIIVTD